MAEFSILGTCQPVWQWDIIPHPLRQLLPQRQQVLVRIEEVNYEWDPKIIQTSMERNMAKAEILKIKLNHHVVKQFP